MMMQSTETLLDAASRTQTLEDKMISNIGALNTLWLAIPTPYPHHSITAVIKVSSYMSTKNFMQCT